MKDEPESGIQILNWNIEWRKPGSRSAMLILERLAEIQPDVACFTEAYVEMFEGTGHLALAQQDYGYGLKPGRRKVMLWSRHPWEEVDDLGSSALPPGRFVRGRTKCSAGNLNVVGVCIPWHSAHVTTGRRDRKRWEEHVEYLSGLGPILSETAGRTIVMGDFNQTVPRTRAPLAAYAALDDAILSKFSVATAAPLPGVEEHLIDHIAHTPDIGGGTISVIDRRGPAGERLSDHLGVSLRVRRASSSTL